MLVSTLLDVASSLPSPAPTISVSLTTPEQSGGGFWSGVWRFVLSPGLGGVAAFAGGLLAFLAATRKSKDDRDKARDDRQEARRDRWWETLTWVYERYTTTEQGRLPGKLALGLLDELFREAQTEHTNVEVAAVVGLFEMTKKQVDDEESQQQEPPSEARSRWSRPRRPA